MRLGHASFVPRAGAPVRVILARALLPCAMVAVCLGVGAQAVAERQDGDAGQWMRATSARGLKNRIVRHPDRTITPRPVAVADTFELARFSFDASGSPDKMGWSGNDITDQPAAFFHVASDLGGGELTGGTYGTLQPIYGSKSVWCGVPPSSGPWCGYRTLPGYGHNWRQYFESPSLTGLTPPLTLEYAIQWDTEDAYDPIHLRALVNGQWIDLASVNAGKGFYDSFGFLEESVALDPATERIRFCFRSDDLWSDQDGLWPTDGAVLLDNLVIRDAGGVVSSEDFEDETDLDTTTDTGWSAGVPAPFGEFGDLYPGATVPQSDLWFQNDSQLWAWFDGLSGKIPFGPDASDLYFHNVIESPPIALSGSGGQFVLSFDVYRDMPLANNVFYYAAVASVVGGCQESFWSSYPFQFGDETGWVRQVLDVSGCVEANAEAVVVRIGVIDLARVFGAGLDHTQAPLVDNVVLTRVGVGGPGISVAPEALFQDNFAANGTTTGTARADAAVDIFPVTSSAILPGDSVYITATNVGEDSRTGTGPAVYCYVTVRPPGQSQKTGSKIEASDRRPGYGKRFPFIETQDIAGVTWNCFRMDSSIVFDPIMAPNQYCFDLDDAVFEPGDTICYFFAAADELGRFTYWSRRSVGSSIGQGAGFVTDDVGAVAASPCEFQILPGGGWASGGDILYVDDADDRGDPTQVYFDQAFQQLGILDKVDRYDVLAASVLDVNNSLASRVSDVLAQVVGAYRTIIWSTGDISDGLIGDGAGLAKPDDFALLFTFLDQHPGEPGLFLSGDNIHQEWTVLAGAGAMSLWSTYYDFTLANGSHYAAGEPVSPLVSLAGACFAEPGSGTPDTLVAAGGYPVLDDFDVLQPGGASVVEGGWPGGGAAVLSQATGNGAGSTARVIGAGFSLQAVRDDRPSPVMDRVAYLEDVLAWLQNPGSVVVGIEPTPTLRNALESIHPNPFNPATQIRYRIAQRGRVTLRVYNVAGQHVRTLVDEVQTPRTRSFNVVWDGTSTPGAVVSTGVYFVRLTARGFAETRKIVMIK